MTKIGTVNPRGHALAAKGCSIMHLRQCVSLDEYSGPFFETDHIFQITSG